MTRTKKTAIALIAALSTSFSLQAAPMVAIGDNASLFVTGVAGITYQDNVYRMRTDRVDDIFFRLQPGVELQMGSRGAASAALFASGEIIRYADQSGLNDELLHLLLTASLDEQVYQISFLASYDERSINSFDRASDFIDGTQRGVARGLDDTALQAHGRYAFSNLTSVSAGLVFNRRDYNDAGLAGSESFSIPVSLFYEVSPVLDARIGYQWRTVDVIGMAMPDVDSYRDNHFTVGLVGQLGSPVFTGDLSVGWMERKFSSPFPILDGRKINSITYDMGITYNAVNSAYTLRLERDYMTSIFGGQNFSRSQVSLLGRFPLVPMWSATAMLGYSFSDYSGSEREQDDYFGRVGINYTPNEYVRLSATFSHNRVEGSGFQSSDYRANTLSISASLRY